VINEEFIYYLWQNRLIKPGELRSVDGEEIEIIDPGTRNLESGPDFTGARIRIAELLWIGMVEIHVKSSDWIRHRHERDDAYQHVILHVVLNHDIDVRRKDGLVIPTLELQGKFPITLIDRYRNLLQNGHPEFPCAFQLNQIQPHQKKAWIDRMLAERLQVRFEEFDFIFQQQAKNWQSTFYRVLARSFGFKINSIPFDLLSLSIPFGIFTKSAHSLEDTDALLFGQSGLIPKTPTDTYTERLARNYERMRMRHLLTPMQAHIWKFGGLRPFNFPTVRIAQLSALITAHPNLSDRITGATGVKDLVQLIDSGTSDYWFHHFRFGDHSKPVSKRIGPEGIRQLLINAVVPFLFFQGKRRHLEVLCDKAIHWLEQCKPEENRVIRAWTDAGWSPADAAESQGLLHLKKTYCDEKKCINCHIGHQLLARGMTAQSKTTPSSSFSE
jgi:hypothetical protein